MNPQDSIQATAPPPAAPATVQTVVRQQVHDTTAALKEGATEAMDTAKEAASSLLTEQKGKLADTLASYGSALKAAGDHLAEDGQNPLVQPARRAARQLEKASTYLREKSRADLVRDLSRFARSNPEWVFGGLFVAGLAAARFLKASAPEDEPFPRRLPVVPSPAAAPAPVPPPSVPFAAPATSHASTAPGTP
jgi:hypothetical protein